MLLLDKNSAKSSSSPLNLTTPKDKPAISFSELLRGMSDTKDKKVVQNGSLGLALANEEKGAKTPKTSSKTPTLTSLMQTQDKKVEKKEKEPLELNPKLVTTLSNTEIKTLMSEARSYLKSKILDSEGFKKAEIKELPTTLRGLVEVAKKFGIDISKITLEEVKEHALNSSKTLKQDTKELHVETQKDAASEKKGINKEAPKETAQIPKEIAQAPKETPKENLGDKKLQNLEAQKHSQQNSEAASRANYNELRVDEKQSEIVKDTKATPLFRAQSAIEHATTEQIVQAKVNNTSLKSEQKTPKDRADEALKLLLRGEKASQESSNLTADFSVNSAKVIAPSLAQESTKSLERLLQGESFGSDQSSNSAKVDSLGVGKADSFEVKVNEAKQMIKYLSDDIKNAINDYKSPFTRVKIQLNPQHLGEVDLTVVQRGKNLHVSISSNNTAINALSSNINELRVQLSNSGINSATFNFNSSSQNGDNSSGAFQQQKQNEQKAQSEYNHFENEEAHEEIISSLEIIVPRYI